jgi:hypothetical protein
VRAGIGATWALVAAGTALAGDAAAPVIERVQVVVYDDSGSMGGARREEALRLLDETARRWVDGPSDVVVAVPFNTDFAVEAAGPQAALDRIAAACPKDVVRASGSESLLRWLAEMEPRGLTRLYDTVADVLPAISAFPGADLALTIVSDGGDNQSRRSAADLAREMDAVFTRRSSERRAVDVYFLRYERVNEALVDELRRIAARSDGTVRVHDRQLDAPAAVVLEVPAETVALVPRESGDEYDSEAIQVVLSGAADASPVTASIVASDGIESVGVAPEHLAPGLNTIRLSVRTSPGYESSFLEDAVLTGVVRLETATASGDVVVTGVVPAGWRAWKGAAMAGLAVVAGSLVLVAAGLALRLVRGGRRSRRPSASPDQGATVERTRNFHSRA